MRTLERAFILAGLASVPACLTLFAPGAGAVLKTYEVQARMTIEGVNISPSPDLSNRNILRTRHRRDNKLRPVLVDCAPEGCSRAIIEEDGGGNPVLKKLLIFDDRTQTTLVPGFGGFMYINNADPQGPSGEFTGTGSTDTTIAWGLVTGWTVTGTDWCNSSPAFLCLLGDRETLESVDPALQSPFYDLGTWTFHSTGWTATPFVHQTTFETRNNGNIQYILRGRNWLGGEVPAVPLFALALTGGALVALGASAIRSRRR